jgi:hypothetical protein
LTEVKCKVSSCHYWGQGDICEADTILIDQDQMRSDTTRMEVSSLEFPGDRQSLDQQRSRTRSQRDRHRMETGMIGATDSRKGHSARTSEATCCRTFRPRGSPKLT